MSLKGIHLVWFRGAASSTELKTLGKSTVIFGDNGSGKSSIVDAVEASLSGGKVGHLSNEYSGRFQEKALLNIKRPHDGIASTLLSFTTGTDVSMTWAKNTPVISGLQESELRDAEYRRVVLRQEELSEFIRSTKGEKYSSVLPLLGLGHLEQAADNIRKLCREIEVVTRVASLKQETSATRQRRNSVFGTKSLQQLSHRLGALQDEYATASATELPPTVSQLESVRTAIEEKLNSMDASAREAGALQELAGFNLEPQITEARRLSHEIALTTAPLVAERLSVLAEAARFGEKLPASDDDVACPACGMLVAKDKFLDHVTSERVRLEAASDLFRLRRENAMQICEEIGRFKHVVARSDLHDWRQQNLELLRPTFMSLNAISLNDLRDDFRDHVAGDAELQIRTVIDLARATLKAGRPDVQVIIKHKEEVDCLADIKTASAKQKEIDRVEGIIGLLSKIESETRREITRQANATFGAISDDVQTYWQLLHGSEDVTDIKLISTGDGQKGVEVTLEFFGVHQDSPRLTLSEGQRNALGLSIFLAMAKRSVGSPIILDDVVVSMDRGHRSRVAPLLETHFNHRQIILLTHDREWFFELQRRLKRTQWTFLRLAPYRSPQEGIRFADEPTEIERARAKIASEPEVALSIIRRVADVAFAGIAEQLSIPMPYVRGEANDHRTGGQLLVGITKAASKSLRVRANDGSYVKDNGGFAALLASQPHLAIEANRGTHTFSASQIEAEDCINSIEAAIGCFTCVDCASDIGAMTASDGNMQCACGRRSWVIH